MAIELRQSKGTTVNLLATPPATRFLEIARPDGSVGRISYDDQGSGPVVLLAPGMGTVRATFRHVAPLLLAAGYRVVTTDYRGLGESDTGWDAYSSAATAADLAALIRHLDAGPVLLYSNSYTSASSVHLAAEHPELLRGAILAGRAACVTLARPSCRRLRHDPAALSRCRLRHPRRRQGPVSR